MLSCSDYNINSKANEGSGEIESEPDDPGVNTENIPESEPDGSDEDPIDEGDSGVELPQEPSEPDSEPDSEPEEEVKKSKKGSKERGKLLEDELKSVNKELGDLVTALEMDANEKNEVISEELSDKVIIQQFIDMAKKCKGVNKKSKMVKELLEIGEEKLKAIEKKESAKDKKEKLANLKAFRKGVTEKNVMNDYAVFTKMDLVKQKKLLKELDEINKIQELKNHTD